MLGGRPDGDSRQRESYEQRQGDMLGVSENSMTRPNVQEK